jgi:integrase
MGCKIRVSKKGLLVYRLFWNKMTSWEGTTLPDTPENRKLVEADAIRITREIKAGRFDYLKWFPAGNKARLLKPPGQLNSIRAYYETWIQRKRPPLVRKSQERDYKQHFNRYILPRFGDLEFNDLTPPRLIEFRDYLLHDIPRKNKKTPKGLSLKTVRNIIDGSFRAMIRDAREIDNILTTDPFESIIWPRTKDTAPDPFTAEERNSILDYFRRKEPFYYPFIFTLFWTGMRPSEVVGLRVGDIDIKQGVAWVSKSRHLGEENATKTVGSTRPVKLLRAAPLLAKIKELRVTETDYFFKNKERGPIDPDQWRKDYWYKALRAQGIRERTFYNYRHTFISLALTAGENIKAIADHCGTSPGMIFKRYGKYMRADFGERLMAAESEISSEMESASDFEPVDFPSKAVASPTGFEPVLPA